MSGLTLAAPADPRQDDLLQVDRNCLRALPCSPFWSACAEQAFDFADFADASVLSAGEAVAAADGAFVAGAAV